MKDIRYGRTVVTLLLLAYSIWVIFGSQRLRETPFESRVRTLEEELASLDEDAEAREAVRARLEEARREAARNTPEALEARIATLEGELAQAPAGSEEARRLRSRIGNLRRRIPAWYDRLPLNLGLDLRGGTEVRMRILSEELQRRRNVVAERVDALREEIKTIAPDTSAFKEKKEELENAEADLAEAQAALDSNIRDAVDVIRNRLDRQGMASIQVMKEGANRIRVELPGMDSNTAQLVINTIKKAGRLEFRLVTDLAKEPITADLWNEMKDRVEPNTRNICLELGRVLTPGEIDEHGLSKEGGYRLYDYLRAPAVVGKDGEVKQPARDYLVEQDPRPLTGRHIQSARTSMDPNSPGFFVVNIRFDFQGARRFGRLTKDNVGRQLAIILDGRLRSAPVLRQAITNGRCEISGNFTQAEARELAVVLTEGSLPVDLQVEMQNNVGASLGEDSIARGMQAIVVGLVFVLIFMAVYYRAAGLVTDFGLALNMVFILAILVMFNAVLTLPGIAGLILTVGMAVDANVLIFERIREELRKGLGLARAIENGYDRAFVTIVDANVTTFITALILLTFGTATVQGFAITLAIGILTSMFVSLFVTRGIFHLLLDLGVLQRLNMSQFIETPKIDFVGRAKIAMAVSVILIVGGLAVFAGRGDENYGHDLLGGILAQPNFAEPVSMDEARGRVDDLREATRAGMEADLRARIADAAERGRTIDIAADAVAVPLDTVGEIGLQGYGVPEEDGYRSLVLRTRRMGLREGPLLEAFGSGALAESFGDAFREAIAKTFPVVRGGLDELRALEMEEDGRPLWEFDLELDTPRSPVEVQQALDRGSKLRDVRARVHGAPGPIRRSDRAEVTLLVPAPKPAPVDEEDAPATDADGDADAEPEEDATGRDAPADNGAANEEDASTEADGADPMDEAADAAAARAALETAVREAIDAARAPTRLAAENAVQAIRTADGEDVGDNRRLVRVSLSFAEPQTDDAVREWLLTSPRIFRADVSLTGLDPLPEPGEEPVERVTVLCSVPVGEIPGEATALAQEQYIRTAVGELRDSGELDFREPFGRFTSVGPAVAGEMKSKAIQALLYSMVAIFLYIWLRFQFRAAFGAGACLALAHDVLFTIGAVAVADGVFGLGVRIDLPVVAALLTIVGYSLNDTIVVYDRIRENLGSGGGNLRQIINLSVNQTLGRTLLTSATTLLVVLALLVLGGQVIRGFAFALLVGVLVGTYSSIFIASPTLVFLADWARKRQEAKAAQSAGA